MVPTLGSTSAQNILWHARSECTPGRRKPSRWWETLPGKRNDRVEGSLLPLFPKSLILRDWCSPPLGTNAMIFYDIPRRSSQQSSNYVASGILLDDNLHVLIPWPPALDPDQTFHRSGKNVARFAAIRTRPISFARECSWTRLRRSR